MKPALPSPLLFLLGLTASACSFDLPQEVRCNPGDTRDGHTCADGIWLTTNPDTPDASSDGASDPDAQTPDVTVPDTGIPDTGIPDSGIPDTGIPDTGIPDTGIPDTCVPESDLDFCDRLNACGEITATDKCDQTRTTQCGGCDAPATCGGAGIPNQCACTAQQACDALDLQCGDADLSNVCANLGVESCGTCIDGTCNPDNTCSCPPGYTLSDGTCVAPSPLIAEVETATGTGIVTTGNMTGSDTDVYIVYVSLRTSQRVVQSVQGLGLNWQLIDVECDGNDSQRLEVWGTRGNAFTSPIVVTMNAPPFGAVVTALRITNVAASNSTGNIVSDNSSTTNNCDNSQPTATYSYPYSPDTGSLVLTGTATAGRAHTPGANWTEVDEDTYNGAQGNNAGLATMARVGAGQDFNVEGSFAQNTHWASISLEIQGP